MKTASTRPSSPACGLAFGIQVIVCGLYKEAIYTQARQYGCGAAVDGVWYFAFGANLSRSKLVDARGLTPSEARPAVLPGWRLAFTHRCLVPPPSFACPAHTVNLLCLHRTIVCKGSQLMADISKLLVPGDGSTPVKTCCRQCTDWHIFLMVPFCM